MRSSYNQLVSSLEAQDGTLREDLSAGARDKALAPELDARAADRLLQTDAVRHRHEATVRDAMRALDRLPGAVLVRHHRRPAAMR